MVSEWNQIIGTIRAIGVWDIVDIVIVAILIYQVIKLIRETRAMQLAKGLILLLLLYFVMCLNWGAGYYAESCASLAGIEPEEATVEQLLELPTMNERAARAVYDFFHKEQPGLEAGEGI